VTDQIVLPRLIGTREAAIKLVDSSELPENLHERPVFLQSRALATSTISFADELVKQLKKRRAGSVVLFAANSEFWKQISDAAARQGDLTVRAGSPSDLYV